MKIIDIVRVEDSITKALLADDPLILSGQTDIVRKAMASGQLEEVIGETLIAAIDAVEDLLWLKQGPD